MIDGFVLVKLFVGVSVAVFDSVAVFVFVADISFVSVSVDEPVRSWVSVSL